MILYFELSFPCFDQVCHFRFLKIQRKLIYFTNGHINCPATLNQVTYQLKKKNLSTTPMPSVRSADKIETKYE